MALPVLPRSLEASLARVLRVMPVAVVTGARQTGKSTLVRGLDGAGGRPYLSLDDFGVLDRARHTPDALARQAARITLDEVQRAPDLLLAVKRAVDEQRRPGRFVLTGSANLLLLESVVESLAGRAAYLTLWPLTRREQLGLGQTGIWSRLLDHPPAKWEELILAERAPAEPWHALARRGGYPPVVVELREAADRHVWFEGYATTYLERDVRSLASVDRLIEFRRLMTAVCLRLGSVQNQAGLARDLAMAPTTVQRYLDLLEASCQLVRVPAFAVNRTTRLIKSPKLYWTDVGLALHLAGESEPRGVHLENLVACDLFAWAGGLAERVSILHWRTTKGAEVDFVIETPRHILPIEVKAAEQVRFADARHLTSFLADYPDRARAGLVLYDGTETFWVAPKVLAAPWWKVM
jgi:predicted AAA+ superfamily ATPase